MTSKNARDNRDVIKKNRQAYDAVIRHFLDHINCVYITSNLRDLIVNYSVDAVQNHLLGSLVFLFNLPNFLP